MMTPERAAAAANLFRAARLLIDEPHKWAKGSTGSAVYHGSDGSRCFLLALQHGRRRAELPWDAYEAAREVLYTLRDGIQIELTIAEWQDVPWRTHADVLDLLDRATAAGLAKGKG